MIRHSPVIFQAFRAARLLVQRSHRDITNLQQFRGGEKHKIYRVVVNGIDDAAFVEQYSVESTLFEFNSARKTSGPRAHYCHIELFFVAPLHVLSRASTF